MLFVFTGIIYDVIVEPPSVGSMTDEHGHQRPVAFLAYRYDRNSTSVALLSLTSLHLFFSISGLVVFILGYGSKN